MQTKRRHVLFLIPTLAGGGAERVIVTLLNHLDRAKFQLSLAVLDTRGAAFAGELPSDVTFLDLQASRVRYALPKVIRVLRQTRPDVAFSTLGHLNLALSIVRPLLPRKTLYLARETAIVSELLPTLKAPKVWKLAYRNFYARFDNIICQSFYMKDDLAANFCIPVSKITVINNPLDTERIKQLASSPVDLDYGFDRPPNNERRFHVVAAGRLSREKGFDLLIEAVALSGLKQLAVTVLGEGPLRGALEELASAKGVGNQVRFIGFQKNPYAFMARADAFVLCSRHEGFPNVVLEALACGTPVIATPAPGGIGEIARASQGVQIASAISAEALSAELLHFVRNRPTAGQADLRQFQVEKIVPEYERIFMGGMRQPGTLQHGR